MSEFNSDFSDNLNEIKSLNENNPPFDPVLDKILDLQPTNVLEKVEEIINNDNIEKEDVVSLALEQITQIHNEIEKTNNSVEAIEEIIKDPNVTDKETVESLINLTNEMKEEAINNASEKINAIVSLMDRLSLEKKEQNPIPLEEPSLLMEFLKKEFVPKDVTVDLLVSLMDNTNTENIIFFRNLEVSYANIIKDGKIDSNDIPELLNLINNIYNHFNKLTNSKNTDLYALTESLLFSSMRIYLELINCPEKDETFKVFKRIVYASIKLIKSQTNKQTQSLFYRFLCCK